MIRALLPAVMIMLSINLYAQEKRLFNGFDGGMMLHTGYLKGDFQQLDYPVSGMPFWPWTRSWDVTTLSLMPFTLR